MCLSVRHIQTPPPGHVAWDGTSAPGYTGQGASSPEHKLRGRPFYRGEGVGVLNLCNTLSDVCVLRCMVVQGV